MDEREREGLLGRGFGRVSPRERLQADRFLSDLLGNPSARRGSSPSSSSSSSPSPSFFSPHPRRSRGAADAAAGAEPGSIFDRIVHGGARSDRVVFSQAPSEIWEVIAFPGSATSLSSLRRGDLAITRARGEVRLAHLRVVGEDLDPAALYATDGLIRRDTLVLRRRAPLRGETNGANGAPRAGRRDAVQRARDYAEAAEDIAGSDHDYVDPGSADGDGVTRYGFADEQAPVSTADLGDATVGAVRVLVRVASAGDERRPSMEEALRLALSRAGQSVALQSFALRGSLYAPGEARVCAFTPATAPTAPAPLVIDCDVHAPDFCGLVLASGADVAAYFPALPAGATTPAAALRRWVVIPKLRDFYGLPADVQRAHRRRWIDVLAHIAGFGFTRAQLELLSTPALRLLVGQNGAAASPVHQIDRGSPPRDRGGVVNGVTLPLPALPVVEPDCYLPVISEREGRLESINAWDAEAGVSLGPIQFNVNPPEGSNEQTLFRFLWRLFIDDRALFDQAFGTLGWRMRFDPAGPLPGPDDALVLVINAGTASEATLRGLRADKARNFRYFQTGVPDQTGFVPAFRRDLAARLRDVVVWPHVQQLILDVSSAWLQPGLAHIRAAGIPAVDRQAPDRDTFTLTAVLLSAYVRFSGCLQPLLRALRPWTSVADKLAHVSDALATLTDPCPTLDARLRAQVIEARAVHAGLDSIRRQNQGAASGTAGARPAEAFDEPDSIPRAVAPHILGFRTTDILASDPLAFRTSLADKAAEMMLKLDDLGIRDDPRGRRDAYVDAIAWNESDDMRRGLRACPTVNGECILSSCALVVRSLWRLLGARDVFTDAGGRVIPVIDPPYRAGSAMTLLRRYAELSGALEIIRTRADLDRANPQKGDVVFINKGTRQHVFTLVARDGDRFVSVDGGQSGPGDGGCCAIHRHERTLSPQAITFVGDDRPITAVAKIARLRFTAHLIDLERRTPAGAASAARTGEAWHEDWSEAADEASGEASDEAPDEASDEAASGNRGATYRCRVDSAESALGAGETTPTEDDVVRALDRIAGTSAGTFAGYRSALVDGTVFGRLVQGVRPEFLRKLQAAETQAATAIGGGGTPSWGIASVGGFRVGSGWHNWGLAVDLNYASSPYIMHEAGEGRLDGQLAPVYHRITCLILGRPQSVIPRDITQGAAGAARTARLYQALSEESAAMVTYFGLLSAPADLDARLAAHPLDAATARAYFGDDTAPTAPSVLRQIMRDYVVLAGRAGPAVVGQTYPTIAPLLRPNGREMDRPFAGNSAARDPQRGFLSIRREIAVALSAQGLRWGAIDFGGESGDVMHFDDGSGALAAQIHRAKTDAAS